MTATDDAGNAVTSTVKVRARVDAVQFQNGTGYLVVGGTTIPLSSVEEVLAASS